MKDKLKYYSSNEFINTYNIGEQAHTMFGSDYGLVYKLIEKGFVFDFNTSSFNAMHVLDTNIEVKLTISRVNNDIIKMEIQHEETKFVDSIHHPDLKYIMFDYHHNYLKRTTLPIIIKIHELYKKAIHNDKGMVDLTCLTTKNNNLKRVGYGDLYAMDTEKVFFKSIITPTDYDKLRNARHSSYDNPKISYHNYHREGDSFIAHMTYTFAYNLTADELKELNILLEKIITFTDKKNFKTFIEENK